MTRASSGGSPCHSPLFSTPSLPSSSLYRLWVFNDPYKYDLIPCWDLKARTFQMFPLPANWERQMQQPQLTWRAGSSIQSMNPCCFSDLHRGAGGSQNTLAAFPTSINPTSKVSDSPPGWESSLPWKPLVTLRERAPIILSPRTPSWPNTRPLLKFYWFHLP